MLTINGTFIFVIISFLIFLFIIKNILFQPITKVIEERDKFYAKNLKTEFESKEKSKALLEEKEAILKETRIEASNIIKQASETAKEKSENTLKEAKKEVLNKIEQNQNQLQKEQINVKFEMKSEISNIVKSIVSKILCNLCPDFAEINKISA